MEGMGFSKPEIVKALVEEYNVSDRTVYYDFQNRSKWQPNLSDIKDTDNILLKILNRYDQIYRHASKLYLTGSDQNVQLGALSIMDRVTGHYAEAAVIPELIARLANLEEQAKRKLRP